MEIERKLRELGYDLPNPPTPAANYIGQITLSYSVIDGLGGSVPATLSFNLAAVNDPAITARQSEPCRIRFHGKLVRRPGLVIIRNMDFSVSTTTSTRDATAFPSIRLKSIRK